MIYVYLLVGWIVSIGATGLVAAYKGYEYANNAAEVRELKADLLKSQQAQANLQQAVDAANEQDRISSQTAQANQDKVDALNKEIQNVASTACVIPDDFLRQLSTIQ
jgi:hypothetical protein